MISLSINYIRQAIAAASSRRLNFAVASLIIAEFRAPARVAMEFPGVGKIPATSSSGTADRVIIDRAVKNYHGKDASRPALAIRANSRETIE